MTRLPSFFQRSACLMAAAAVLAPLAVHAAPVPSQMIEQQAAKLQWLDKVTARTSTFAIKVGETKAMGSLRITLRACRENPPIETPESAAFLEVVEIKPGEQAEQAFSGWMFASSPALSAMENPIYDVWVLGCEQ
ncbi:glycosyl hydrolase family 5 [Azospirillum thiophilum]|uniref:Glycosyl hydrolase family 5 n=2 Tax=Azospirillum thiophilum TaxID=528244 RepID=A0AAC8VWV7_9PROT|nr:glycosyl hydrolase family 5 [Azospirillum thiophilum]KJR65344.1 glycosyl hydrolase family 5 [Azospirillum thiophilum]